MFTPDRLGFWQFVGFLALIWMFFLIPLWGRLIFWLFGRAGRLVRQALVRSWRLTRGRGVRRKSRCYALLAEYASLLAPEREAYFRALIARGIRPRALSTLLRREAGGATVGDEEATTQLVAEVARLRDEQQQLVSDTQVALERAWYHSRELDGLAAQLTEQQRHITRRESRG